MKPILLPPHNGGRWAIARKIDGRWVHVIQDSRLESPIDAQRILRKLGLPETKSAYNRYFPHQGTKGRCPTLELLELMAGLEDTVSRKYEIGV